MSEEKNTESNNFPVEGFTDVESWTKTAVGLSVSHQDMQKKIFALEYLSQLADKPRSAEDRIVLKQHLLVVLGETEEELIMIITQDVDRCYTNEEVAQLLE